MGTEQKGDDSMSGKCVWIPIAAVLFLGLALAASSGCRSKARQEFEFKKGEVARAIYEQTSGWSFWSEGQGKTIEISPTVNGVQF